MRLRSLGFAALVASALVQSCAPTCAPAPPPPPPPPPPPVEVTSITVDGQGNGHGRGLSQWGAYGSAVNRGWSWQQILDHYYGGTRQGSAANDPIGVSLMALDDAAAVAVISVGGTATWNGGSYRAIHAYEFAPNRWDVYGTTDGPACIGGGTGWVFIGDDVPGPLRITTPLDQSAAAAGDVLGLCQPNGSVIHYRGDLVVTEDPAGRNRVVNHVLLEDYLRGVLSREVSTSWGNAGGGAGMHSLYAMAVAARSYALAQNRFPRYGAKTCDTSTCQVYGGAAHRADPTAPTSHPGARVCEAGNATFECANTDRAARDTAGVVRVWPDGRIVSTEYSATHGPRSAGGTFPPVDDSASNVPQNPLYTWRRSVDAVTLETRYALGNLTGARTERDPASPYDGVWGHRVVLEGTERTVTLTALQFRNAMGFPSHGFTITGVVR